MVRLIFRAFQCEMELDYITVSRLLLLVPVANVCESIENWFQLIYPNFPWLQYCVLLKCTKDQSSHFCACFLGWK